MGWTMRGDASRGEPGAAAPPPRELAAVWMGLMVRSTTFCAQTARRFGPNGNGTEMPARPASCAGVPYSWHIAKIGGSALYGLTLTQHAGMQIVAEPWEGEGSKPSISWVRKTGPSSRGALIASCAPLFAEALRPEGARPVDASALPMRPWSIPDFMQPDARVTGWITTPGGATSPPRPHRPRPATSASRASCVATGPRRK